MFKLVGTKVAWTLLAMAGWLTASFSIAGQIKPQFDHCTLELDGRIAKASVAGNARVEWAGDRRFVVENDAVSELDANGVKILWSIRSPDGRRLLWRGHKGQVALFTGYGMVDERRTEAESPGQVRRLDLAARKWLSPLAAAVDVPRGARTVVVDIRVSADRVAVLSQRTQVAEEQRDQKTTAYCVSVFVGDAEKPRWSREYEAQGSRPEPGVYLWAETMPDYAGSAVQRLTWLGDRLLVCAGEKEDLICLDAAGEESWRVRKIWEYQRGFIGPSVWQHYMARFGIDDWDEIMVDGGKHTHYAEGAPGTLGHQAKVEELRKAFTAVQKAFDEQSQCAIIGGPVVVPVQSPTRQTPESIFVAVAKGPNQWNWGYLSDCIVYELSGDGRVITMANLPRMVNGGQSGVSAGAVVWGCQQSGMVRIDSQALDVFGMGPGGSDRLCNITWYRQFPAPSVNAWLETGKVGQVTAMSPTHAFLTLSGGYIQEKGQQVYRFPITVVDLTMGAERTATLRVPFDGNLPLPEKARPDENGRISTWGPHLLGVTHMRTIGGRLQVTLGMEGSASSVWFGLEDVVGKPPRDATTRPAAR
ncbi:MAG: hypothetical protein ABSH20_02265 [Tepidisphaeraceae bacterium]|jgi:hypothetical protein